MKQLEFNFEQSAIIELEKEINCMNCLDVGYLLTDEKEETNCTECEKELT